MVRNWLVIMVEIQLFAQEVLLLAVGRCMGLFYADNSMVVLQYPEWLQGVLNVIIGIFIRYGLLATVVKSKSITCHLGTLQSGMS